MTTPVVIMQRVRMSNTVIKRCPSNERVVHAMLLEREASHVVCDVGNTLREIYSVGHLISTK
jgi:hypothetical protein